MVSGAAGASLTIALFVTLAFRPYADRPPLAHTGGFGEETCRQCHFDNPLNEPGGSLSIDGVPPAYQPGASYRLTVRLRRAGLARAGFQLAVRQAIGPGAGRQAGVLAAVD